MFVKRRRAADQAREFQSLPTRDGVWILLEEGRNGQWLGVWRALRSADLGLKPEIGA
jgi:hypothetical protein